MNQAPAQQLLPAKLRWTSHETTFLRPVAVEHPALADLRELADTVPWSEFPVFKYWELESGAETRTSSLRSPTASQHSWNGRSARDAY